MGVLMPKKRLGKIVVLAIYFKS